jgi:hypothetical protein
VKAPDDFKTGLSSRAESMEKGITEKSQFSHVTDKMDAALRNMWTGLRRWDRDEQHNDDLFADLEEVSAELADLDASASNVTPPKGRETDEKSEELAKKYHSNSNEAPTPTPSAPALLLAEVLRRKESAINFVLNEIREAAITVMDKALVRSLALADVIGMTKSDRTQQLIRAAYYVGVLRGVKLLHSKLQDGE